MKRVFLVIGMGGSGTRLVTRLLIKGGCFGDGDHRQKLDEFVDGIADVRSLVSGYAHSDSLVFRRSYPDHGGRTPDLNHIRSRFVQQGYKPIWVVLIRRPARFDFRYEGYEKIFRVISAYGDRYCIFDTSVLFMDPQNSLIELGEMTGLPILENNTEAILNPDEKWLEIKIVNGR